MKDRCKICGSYSLGNIIIRDKGLNKNMPVVFCTHAGQIGAIKSPNDLGSLPECWDNDELPKLEENDKAAV